MTRSNIRVRREPSAAWWLLALASACVPAHPTQAEPSDGVIALRASQVKITRLATTIPADSATFEVDDATTIVVTIATTADTLATSVRAPGGQVLTEQTVGDYGGEFCSFAGADNPPDLLIAPSNERGSHYIYTFPTLGSGIYTVAFATDPPPSQDVAVITELIADSPVVANLFATEPVLTQGATAVLVAAIFEDTTPVTGAAPTVTLVSPSDEVVTVPLFDNGTGADYTVGDGLYSGLFEASEVGEYIALGDITGIDSHGRPFARTGATYIRVVPASATFTGAPFTDQGVDTNANGKYDLLRISHAVQVSVAGTYILTVVLRTPLGKDLLAYGQSSLATGAQTVSADIDAATLLANDGDGAYTVTEAELVFVGAEGAVPADSLTGFMWLTQPYLLSQFDQPPIRLTGQNSDYGVDSNANGKFDTLVVGLGIQASVAGTYSYGARLLDLCVGHIQFVSGEQSLPANAPAQLTMSFDGALIGPRGIDGPYILADFGIYGPGGSLVVSTAAMTQAYGAQEFEAYVPPTDCNGNGIPDACELHDDPSLDCDMNGVPDQCQHSPGTLLGVDVGWGARAETGPEPRRMHALAYDSHRKVIVLFGGYNWNGTYLSDTWEYDGSAWALRASSGPSGRYGHALAYDSARHVTVLFGGTCSDGDSAETWEWDGANWTLRPPGSYWPNARYGHTMVYDAARGVVFLFGGLLFNHDAYNDTWQWDGTA